MSPLQLRYYPWIAPEFKRLATSGLVQYLMKQFNVTSVAELVRAFKNSGDANAISSEDKSHFWYLKNQGQPIRSQHKIERIESIFPKAHKLLDHALFELLTLGNLMDGASIQSDLKHFPLPYFIVQFKRRVVLPNKLRTDNAWQTLRYLKQLSNQSDYNSLACLLYYYYQSHHTPDGLLSFIERLLLKASKNVERNITPSYIQTHLTESVSATFYH
ncbi:hypothetical protein [Alteromonas lipotrueae]|uniref:hypothetical protein n=1 Tax=Alteromonas lipotrueae TaxID=2803814 RepID=UPI001C451075|nr:hypothetical protein [Alteromonas lipotrueae]